MKLVSSKWWVHEMYLQSTTIGKDELDVLCTYHGNGEHTRFNSWVNTRIGNDIYRHKMYGILYDRWVSPMYHDILYGGTGDKYYREALQFVCANYKIKEPRWLR